MEANDMTIEPSPSRFEKAARLSAMLQPSRGRAGWIALALFAALVGGAICRVPRAARSPSTATPASGAKLGEKLSSRFLSPCPADDKGIQLCQVLTPADPNPIPAIDCVNRDCQDVRRARLEGAWAR